MSKKNRSRWYHALWGKKSKAKRQLVHRVLRSESLEARQMMAGDFSLAFHDVSLLRDTGYSDTDGVTANWTIQGAVQGTWGNGVVAVEFDLDRDGQPDAMSRTATIPEQDAPQMIVFAFDPREANPQLQTYVGQVEVSYRARVVDSGTTVASTDWQVFRFQAEAPPQASLSIKELKLERDTGSSDSDRVTWHAVIVGTLTDGSSGSGSSGSDGSGSSGAPQSPGSSGGGSAGDGATGGFGSGGGSFGSGGQPGGGTQGGGSSSGGFTSGGSSGSSFAGGGASTGGSYGTGGGSSFGGGGSPGSSWGSSSGGAADGSSSQGDPSGSGSSGGATLGSASLPSDQVPPFLQTAGASWAGVGIEWDWNGDGEVDARTWLEKTDQFARDFGHLPYGRHSVRARVAQWDNEYSTLLFSDWHSLTFDYVAAPAPNIVALSLANDTGVPGDQVTADSTMIGKLEGDPRDIEQAPLYWDFNQDGRADAVSWSDAQGHFVFHPRGLPAGRAQVAVRASRWDAKSQAEVFGNWTVLTFTYEPQLPPDVGSLWFVGADNQSNKVPGIQGQLAVPRGGVMVEWDDDKDGIVDAVTLSGTDGSFTRSVVALTAGQHSVNLRTRQWDDWDQIDRVASWKEYTFEVSAPESLQVSLSNLRLFRDTGLSDTDRVTSDNRIVGTITTSSHAQWTWVEVDRDGDQVTDFSIMTGDHGEFVLTPSIDSFGNYAWSVRGAALDEATSAIVWTPWSNFSWVFAADPIEAPRLADVRLLSDTAIPGDGVTSLAWVTGRVVTDTFHTAFVEVDENADGVADAVVAPSTNGQFLYTPTHVAPGNVRLAFRAVAWDNRSGSLLTGAWNILGFIYQEMPTEPAVLYEMSTVGTTDDATPSATVQGRIATQRQSQALTVQFDLDGDDQPDVVGVADHSGAFQVTIPAPSTGTFTVRVRTREVSDNGESVVGAWQDFVVGPVGGGERQRFPAVPVLERITGLRLLRDTGNSDNDLSTEDARVTGRVVASKVAGRIVEWDIDGDGRSDGFAVSDSEGAFTIDPTPASEGLVQLAVRLADAQGLTGTDWYVLQFVYSSQPDGNDAQNLARVVLAHQQARQAAVDEYLDALEQALNDRQAQLQRAAAEHQAATDQNAAEYATDLIEAHRQFYRDVKDLDDQFARRLREAADQFAQRMAQTQAGQSLIPLPDLTWPTTPPPDGRGPLPSADQFHPPVSVNVPLISLGSARLPTVVSLRFRQAYQELDSQFQTASQSHLRQLNEQLQRADEEEMAAVRRARQAWTAKVRSAENEYHRQLQSSSSDWDLGLAQLQFQQAAQQAENLYVAALEAHQRLLASKLIPLQEALNAAISAAVRRYEQDMQELSDFYARNPPSYPMEYSDFEKAWRKRAFSRRETAIADAYLTFDRAVADAYRTKERQDAEARYQRDTAILIAEHNLRQVQLEAQISDQQNRHNAWANLQQALVSAEDELGRALSEAAVARQLRVADAIYQDRVRTAATAQSMAYALAAALRGAWRDGDVDLPELPEVQLAVQLDANQASYQEQLADLLKQIALDLADGERVWLQARAAAEQTQARTYLDAARVRNQTVVQGEIARRQSILDAVAVEARLQLQAWHTYRQSLIDARRTRDLNVADENHRYNLDQAEIRYDYRIQRRDIYLDYMGEMKDTPIDVPLAELARQTAFRAARAENTHRHNRLNIDERWSDATLAAFLAYRLQGNRLAEQTTVTIVGVNDATVRSAANADGSFALAISQAGIQYERDVAQAEQVRDGQIARREADRNVQTVALRGDWDVADATALEQFGRAVARRMEQQVASWAQRPDIPQPWAVLHSSLSQAAVQAAITWYVIQHDWTDAQAAANVQRAMADAASFVHTLTQQLYAYDAFLQDSADAAANYWQGVVAAYVHASQDAARAVRTFQLVYAGSDRQYEDAIAQAEVTHDEAVRDAYFRYEHDAADALLALVTEQVDMAGYARLLQAARRQQRVAEAAAYVTYVSAATSAYQSWTTNVSQAEVAQVRQLAQAAVQETSAETQLRTSATAAQLYAWQVWQSTHDHLVAGWVQQRAVHYSDWVNAITLAGTDVRKRQGMQEFDTRSAHAAAQEAFRTELLAHDARQRAALVENLAGRGVAADRVTTALARFQVSVADAEAAYAARVAKAAERRTDRQRSAHADLLDALATVDITEATDVMSAYTEWILGQTAALKHYGVDVRQAWVVYFVHQQTSLGMAESDTIAAWARWAEAAAQSKADLAIGLAGASGQLAQQVAVAAADLYIAGESFDVEGKDEASLTPAQRAYVQAVRRAEAQWAADVRNLAVAQATKLGDAWIVLHGDLGTALQDHTNRVVAAERQLAAGWQGASTQFATMITNAARRYVDRLTDAVTTRRMGESSGRENWLAATHQAELTYVQQVGAADVDRAAKLARAEVAYYVETTSGGDPLDGARRDWIQRLGDKYVVYRSSLANADAMWRTTVTRIERDAQLRSARADTTLISQASSVQDRFAQQIIDAMSAHQLTVMQENNNLHSAAAQADGSRKIAYADAVANHAVAVAQADKDWWIALATALGGDTGAAADRRQVAIAAADRQAARAFADADHLWRSLLIPAETWHFEQGVSAAVLLDKQIAAAHAAARTDMAFAEANWRVAQADVQADKALDMTHAVNNWRLDRASAEDAWLAAQWDNRAQVLAGFSSQHDNASTRYAASKAELQALWWQTQQSEHLDLVRAQNHVDLLYTLNTAAAFRTLAAREAGAYQAREAALASADAAQRTAYADSRALYTQLVVSPAQQADQVKSDAERDYRRELADAQYYVTTGGSYDEYRRRVVAAEQRRAAAFAAADAVFAQHEVQAADTQRRIQAAADVAHLRAQQSAHQSWATAVQSALTDWTSTVNRLQSRRAAQLAQLEQNYLANEAQSWAEALAAWQNDSPWAMRDRQVATATSQRQESLALASSRFEQLRYAAQDAFWAQQAALNEDWLERTFEADSQFVGQQESAYTTLLEKQTLADANLADAGIAPSAHRWGGLLPEIGFWLPPFPGRLLLVTTELDLSGLLESAMAPVLQRGVWLPVWQSGLEGNPAMSMAGAALSYTPVAAPSISTPVMQRDFGAQVPPPPQLDSPMRPGEYLERMQLEAQAGNGMYEPPTHETRPQITWFLEDLGLMMKYPVEALQGAREGAETSKKVLINGTATTLRSTLTLGYYSSPWELLEVTDQDRYYGYDGAFTVMRVSQEVLVGALSGKVASLKVTGWGSLGVHAARYWDLAQNVSTFTQGAYGVVAGDGLTWENGLNMVAGAAGMGGHVTAAVRKMMDNQILEALAFNNRFSPYRIGVAVKLADEMDPIGHAMVVFDGPDGLIVRGMYPRDGVNFGSLRHQLQFLFGGNRSGFYASIEDDLDVFLEHSRPGGLLKTRWTPVSEEQFYQGLEFVDDIERAAENGELRYHLFNQCAVFARRTLEAARVKPFFTVGYPPMMFRKVRRVTDFEF